MERLAAEALKSKSSNAGSASKAMQEGENARKGVQEPEAGVVSEVHAVVLTSKTVKPCAYCEAITHRKCAGCRVGYYCSLDCQRATYAEHQKECAALRDERRKEAKAKRAAARASKGDL